MSVITAELEQTLRQLDPSSAASLEQLVRHALALVSPEKKPVTARTDANGWPLGYFDRTAGSFEGEPLDAPDDRPAEPAPTW